MSNNISTIFEFDTIGCHDGVAAKVSKKTYEWLESETLTGRLAKALKVDSASGHRCLKSQNYVGVIQGPFREGIEILPKTARRGGSFFNSRTLLLNMLRQSGELPTTETEIASMQTTRMPLHESFIRRFIDETRTLVKRGIKSSYVRKQESSSFLKGKLLINEQLNRHAATAHLFAIEYDEYLVDRPENRVIKAGFLHCLKVSKNSENIRHLRELLFAFDEVTSKIDWKEERLRYSFSRDMKYYHSALSWSELILQNLNPLASEGSAPAVSLLFPMEKVFEKFVFKQLRRKLLPGAKIKYQARSKYLASYRDKGWFRLEPDFILSDGRRSVVLDTKWKLIDSTQANSVDKFAVSREDMYQLYAYGMKYLDGTGDMFLVYPRQNDFQHPIEEPLLLDETGALRLWIVPFPLEGLSRELWNLPEECRLEEIVAGISRIDRHAA